MDGFDQDEGSCECDEGAEVCGCLFTAQGDAFEAFELSDGLENFRAAWALLERTVDENTQRFQPHSRGTSPRAETGAARKRSIGRGARADAAVPAAQARVPSRTTSADARAPFTRAKVV